MIIEFDGISIEVTRKKIKNMHLRIYPPDGLVKVSAPLKFSEQLIRKTLEAKGEWIHKQRERMRNNPIIEKCTLETGSTVVFQGKHYLFIVQENQGPTQIKINDEIMYCYVKPNSSYVQKQILLDNWYRYQLQALLPDLIKHWEIIVGVKVSQWGIKKMKTRWGSCNTKAARIWLNLNLIKKNPICLEYVLVHELVHLLEPSHNNRFYHFMNKFMPEWRQYECLLEGRAL